MTSVRRTLLLMELMTRILWDSRILSSYVVLYVLKESDAKKQQYFCFQLNNLIEKRIDKTN